MPTRPFGQDSGFGPKGPWFQHGRLSTRAVIWRAGSADSALSLVKDGRTQSRCTLPYQARVVLRVLSVSVIRPTPSRAPGDSPKAFSKSARMSRV